MTRHIHALKLATEVQEVPTRVEVLAGAAVLVTGILATQFTPLG